ncbi:MAG TPA: sugar phosphate isomerase/epimerase [Candidatus Acutalibacter pullicola]|uniref:Sugar phosphate isomerase/epimerase n=1 Tax=Candidatus Acutalibacter pullicola TaxID=2838417 RepID=A0A9D2MX48_9FIRM|nr:sugar phosphate isomerase/epimerase [Candidatus Acutalibacter pullicola]
MKVNIGTYSFGGIASYLGLGPTLLEKFQTIKSLGYDGVELLPVDLDNDVEDIKKWAQETGLEIVSIHAKPTEDIVKKMAALGGKAVIWAGTDFCNKEEALALAKELDEMAAMAEPYGIKVGYHNHSKEFFVDEGLPLMEYVLDNSSKCYMQLDCGWAMNAGTYPPSFIRKYKNRILAIHVKENDRVQGPGPRPASAKEATGGSPFANVKELPLEQRQKMLEEFTARSESPEGKKRFEVQCKLGAPESNMDWQEIKNALDEQDLEAFWVVERENFYDDHDKCLAEDCAWLKEHIQ